MPDDLPVFPRVQEDPRVFVTLEDGTPLTPTTTVHRGDVLLVHGSGFSPQANRGGFPFPVPPGTPNGLFVLYGAFPEQWRPSEGVDSAARAHPHDRMAWVMPEGTLESIPSGPIEMRRSIARQAQPMNRDGSFTARLVVDPPENTTGDRWGVYVYPGAGSHNAAEEWYIPLAYSPEPGPHTPPAPTRDLLIDAPAAFRFAGVTGGAVKATGGAAAIDGAQVSFSRDRAAESDDGVRKYKGTVVTTAKFTLVEVALADPWLSPLPGGNYAVSALVSRSYNVGPDEMVRVPVGVVSADRVLG
ncbi:HtaA protein [Corynebacterium sp. zg331]|nr:HtaA protein [Corynebacterium sp. zg331]